MTHPDGCEVASAQLSRRRFLGLMGGLAGALALGLGARDAGAGWRPWYPPIPATSFSAAVPLAWFTLMLDRIRRTPGFSPPVASRALGYAGLALYEAVVPGMPGYRSLNGQLDGLAPMRRSGLDATHHWPTVANSALAATLSGLFPSTPEDAPAAIDALQRDIDSQLRPGVPALVYSRSVNRGYEMAGKILDWARDDGGHEGYLRNVSEEYQPPQGDGLWTPTPPSFAPALQPYWGDNRTFAVGAPAGIPVSAPPPFSTEPGSAFYRSAHEVYETVNNLTPEQEAVARFWADDPGTTATPPGHSCAILNQVVAQLDLDLGRAAEAYAKLGMAAADAFICCWHTKYRFNLVRPITYIQAHIDPGWGGSLPVTTPPFPEYTSGHSVQSAAAATVLTDLFGDLGFTDRTHEARGMAPRTFRSFSEFAEEAAISRLYGGIHYREAIEVGIEQGRLVGEKVNLLKFRTAEE